MIRFIFALFLSLPAFSQQMDPSKWDEDVAYLHRRIMKEFGTFTPQVKNDFSAAIAALRPRLGQMKDHEIRIELMQIMSLLGDGHTEINVAHETSGFHRLPVLFYFFNNELYVTVAHEKYRDVLGSKVTRFGNLTTQEIFKKLTGLMSKDNDMEFLHTAPTYLALTEVLSFLGGSSSLTECTLTLEGRDGSVRDATLAGLSVDDYSKGPWVNFFKANNIPVPQYLSNPQKWYWYKYDAENKMMYFHFRRVNSQDREQSINKFRKELFEEIDREKPELFVIDLRNNNGGNYHFGEPFAKAVADRPWLNLPGKVWVVTGRATFSAASVTSIFFKQQTKATLIGEAGRAHPNKADNNEYLTLPNSKILVEYTTRVLRHWPELGDADRIPVDVEVPPQFEKYVNGIDPVLEYILRKQ